MLARRQDTDRDRSPAPTTIDDVLFAEDADSPLAERGWVVLVNLVAAGDQRALRQLYERTHRLVFSLIARITNSRDVAGDLTVEVFRDIWRRASSYDASAGSVIGWIMSLARTKALDRLRREQELDADILAPTTFLWGAVARGIAEESGLLPVCTAPQRFTEPGWTYVAAGVSCKLLATDEQRERVSMLVHLAPGVEYPLHTHAGLEQLHVLQGALRIDQRDLHAGDYHRAAPGTSDARLSSQTGCTCVILTSPSRSSS